MVENTDDMKTLILTLILAASASATAPDFVRNADVCNGWYKAWDDKVTQEMQDLPFVIASHPDKDMLAKARKLNTRLLEYVTFYQMPADQYYQHANIKDHPEWVCIHADGKPGESADNANADWLTTCPNSPTYHEYVIKTVRLIMEAGVDGLFIDNGHPDRVCEGPKFGKHKHLYPDQDNNYAYRKLLEDISAVVKSYGADKIVIVNPGNPWEQWRGACDGQMLESYICSWAWDNRWKEEKILQYQKEWGAKADAGDAVIALSYLDHTKAPVRDDAFYCFAWARLSGFIWADWFTGIDTARDLYKVRLGPAVGPMKTNTGYYSREFKYGMVVASKEAMGASFRISAKDHPSVLDLYNTKFLKPGKSGDYEIKLDKGEGRVYTW